MLSNRSSALSTPAECTLVLGIWYYDALFVTGVDAAYRLRAGPYLRTRLRAGRVADAVGELGDSDEWVSGADLGLVTSTPFGALSLTAGASRRGNLRVFLDVGPMF